MCEAGTSEAKSDGTGEIAKLLFVLRKKTEVGTVRQQISNK